jgi:hypothetical protein
MAGADQTAAEQCVQILAALQSPDKAVRKPAEDAYEKMAEQHTVAAQALTQVMTTAPGEDSRQQAAVLFRQLLGRRNKQDKTKSVLASLGDLTALKALLLGQLEKEPVPKVQKSVAHLVAHVAGYEPGDIPIPQAWPQLLPKLLEVVQVQARRAAALLVLQELAEELCDLLAPQQQFLSVIESCAQDPDPEVKTAAMKLSFTFALHAKHTDTLKPFIQPLLLMAAELAKSKDTQKNAQELLTVMNDVAEDSPSFLKDALAPTVFPAVVQFAQNEGLPSDIRRMSLQILVSMSKAKKGKLAPSIPGYIQEVVNLCTKFCLALDGDMEAWSAQLEDDEDEDEEGEDLVDVAKEGLDVLIKNVGAEHVLPLLFPNFMALMQQNTWQATHAVLSLMAVIAEYVDEESQVNEMVKETIKLLPHPNMRVRYAAWGCLAQFAEDHDETVPETFADETCQAFLVSLDDPVHKVLKRSLEGFGIVAQFIDRDLLDPACQPILQKLAPRAFQALEQFPKLTEEALAVMAILAQVMEEGFSRYYGELMPLLMQIMTATAASAEKRSCFGRAVECIAHVGSTGGAATFKGDAQKVMQAMIEVNKTTTGKEDDVGKEYILTASQVICKTLKKEFAPMVPHILPMVVELLYITPTDINAGGIDLESQEQTQLTISVVTTAEGETKVLGLKTSEIEDMNTALNFVKTMADELEEAFAPYVKDTATAMLKVFDFELGEDVREIAFEVWASLIAIARKTNNSAVLRELLQSLMSRVLGEMEKTDDLGWELTQANGLSLCIKAAGPSVLQENEISATCAQVFKLFKESLERRDRIDQEGGPQVDDDEDEVQHDADSDDFNVVTVDIRIRAALCEVLGAVMQHHADLFVKLISTDLLQLVERFLTQTNVKHKDEEKKLAVYVICDIIDHLKDRAVNLWPKLVPTLIQCVADPDPKIAQAAAFGLALAAPNPQFAAFAPQATAQLQALLPTMEKKGKKHKVRSLGVRDNAVSAYGLLLRHHRAAVPAAADPAVWKQWLGYLPLKHDEEEAVKVHEMLIVLVLEQHAELLGKDYAHLPKILEIIAEIYGNTDLVTDDTTSKIHTMIKTLGEAGLSKFGASLSPKQQKKIMRIWTNAQQQGGFTPAPRA